MRITNRLALKITKEITLGRRKTIPGGNSEIQERVKTNRKGKC